MHHALRCIKELFINLFLKKFPDATITKYIYGSSSRNLQVPLKDISKICIQFIYFQAIPYFVFKVCIPQLLTQESTAELSLLLTTKSVRMKRAVFTALPFIFKDKLQRAVKPSNESGQSQQTVFIKRQANP